MLNRRATSRSDIDTDNATDNNNTTNSPGVIRDGTPILPKNRRKRKRKTTDSFTNIAFYESLQNSSLRRFNLSWSVDLAVGNVPS